MLDIGKKLTKRNADGALDDDSIMHPTGRGAGWIHASGGKIFDLPDNLTHFMLDQPYFDHFDQAMRSKGVHIVSYADDILIFARSPP
ncbi:MAG: hypothetical protein PHV61_11265 [Limnochordia bacterium]|nr:hypothetical protein [Limnochordia bacterium]MDD2630720.1 hypothetical protein [Limnochordia bacterium]